MKKPITPRMHGIADYGFGTALLLLPSICGLGRKARNLSYSFAAATTIYSAFTDYPSGINRRISLKKHKVLDLINLGALLTLPLLLKEPTKNSDRRYFAGFFTAGLINVLLTDWNGDTGKKIRNNRATAK